MPVLVLERERAGDVGRTASAIAIVALRARATVSRRARGARFEIASPVEGPCEACRLRLVFARKVESGLVVES